MTQRCLLLYLSQPIHGIGRTSCSVLPMVLHFFTTHGFDSSRTERRREKVPNVVCYNLLGQDTSVLKRRPSETAGGVSPDTYPARGGYPDPGGRHVRFRQHGRRAQIHDPVPDRRLHAAGHGRNRRGVHPQIRPMIAAISRFPRPRGNRPTWCSSIFALCGVRQSRLQASDHARQFQSHAGPAFPSYPGRGFHIRAALARTP